MHVIPVIDLKNGVVVRARFGQREAYAPIVTALAPTSAPRDVVAGLLKVFPFPIVYAADLDAIEARGSHEESLLELCEAFPGVAFWVDAGVRDAEQARSWLARQPRAHLVLGSENLGDLAVLEALRGEDRILLSLDFRGEIFLGPEALYAAPELWPRRVIAMTLSRVGATLGPDMERIRAIVALANHSVVFAAGGLRGPSDLATLSAAGVSGVLVASALHDGALTREDLAALVTSA